MTGEGPGYERGGEGPEGGEEVEVREAGKAVTAEGPEYEGGGEGPGYGGRGDEPRYKERGEGPGCGKGSGIRIWVVWVRVMCEEVKFRVAGKRWRSGGWGRP